MTPDKPPAPAAGLVVDPVCGIVIDRSDAAGRIEQDGRTDYFCSTACLERFNEAPERFVCPRGAARL